MQTLDQQAIIETAIATVAEAAPLPTGGKWLENLTVTVGPHIREWDIADCWPWAEWPEREERYPSTTKQDIGIDCVAVRRSDGEPVAIQCKSRQLDEHGRGDDIAKAEIDSFSSASAGEFWAERWIVTNGDNRLGGNAPQVAEMHGKPIKVVNIANDLLQQQAAFTHEECPHCEPNPDGEERQQSKSCMQAEAIAESVRILRNHEQSDSGGLPVGQARGKIILPCGTGKTRISLRIVEELTPLGDLSVVLCPSIALVAQIRREYLQHAEKDIRALAVCSDITAGYDPENEDKVNTQDDPTKDNSNVSAAEVKGAVTTDASEIADWIRKGNGNDQVNVIFGTYQSSHRVAEALLATGTMAAVMVADEAHRTAGLRRVKKLEERLRDFTVCHDNDRFPAKYRIYQTATPRVYDTSGNSRPKNPDWVVRNMDDETVFGVELYRKSYMEAVANGWLADYRIIALGVNDANAYQAANILAQATGQKGRNALTTAHFLKGLTLALVMGGATTNVPDGQDVVVRSCISFMNTVAKSKAMSQQLQSDTVRKWVQRWLDDNRDGQKVADYTLEHLDASSNVTTRDNAKAQLGKANQQNPHGVINVGIFGEGTDAPSLSAVAFLEARKSPIDVIQAVGRAMRTAEGKEMGYIICPIMIPPNVDAEQWLKTSGPEDGWQELGQILLALRAHDSRIEDDLSELLQLYIPEEPETEATVVAIANREDGRIQYHGHVGAPGEAQKAAESVLEGHSRPSDVFVPLRVMDRPSPQQRTYETTTTADAQAVPQQESAATQPAMIRESNAPVAEPATVIAAKKNSDGNVELRVDSVVHAKPAPDGTPGRVDIQKTKAKAKDMINKDTGVRLPHSSKRKPRRTQQEVTEGNATRMLKLTGMDDHGNAITANLLTKSGLSRNRVIRDLNILEASVSEAARHLRDDELSNALDAHFLLDNLKEESRKKQADGCTIAALLMMNAAMLHQRIAAGRWLSGVSDLEAIKNDTNVVRRVRREWERIMRHDFHPVLIPAVEAIQAVEDTGKIVGLERSLRHIAAEAERIAETYADMGADHAGPLFNRVMGNQASDGAFFTRPVAASIAARLTLDACGEVDWSTPQVWLDHKTVDLACGSGTLLAAILTDAKRRAREQGASETRIAELQKLAVEETIKGMDINPVSLQLAASQLTAGNTEIRYRQMGLHLMPYGPQPDNQVQVSVGTLELLGQKAIVSRYGELGIADDLIHSQSIWPTDDAELEDAVHAAKDAHIVIMNPPFSSRKKMGEKFPQAIKTRLQRRVDAMEAYLTNTDAEMTDFTDKNALEPLFTALAEKCMTGVDGILTMINPTIALCASSAVHKRRVLAQRYHIHTVLTSHRPGLVNLSQNTGINESIVIAKRHNGCKPPTRFINLDRMPTNESEVEELHAALQSCSDGDIADGWGTVSHWSAERMVEGDWTPAVWRHPALAEAAHNFSVDANLRRMDEKYTTRSTLQELYASCRVAEQHESGGFPVVASKSSDGQLTVQSIPDQHWIPKNADQARRNANGGTYPEADKILQKEGHLLITHGQNNSTARVTATAAEQKYVGTGWMPVLEASQREAKALAVFLNSTPGRLQIMRNPGTTLVFPLYNPADIGAVRIPDVNDDRVIQTLADCWERTKDMTVPQFRDGECEVRRLWDEAVAEAMGWDSDELARLRQLLHNEPHVRGLGYGQYADEAEPPDRERFRKLADQWEYETVLLSSTEQVTEHPAHQEIVSMGEPVVPLILDRMQSQGGHWFHALRDITGADPVDPDDRGNVPAMQEAWLDWGERNGFA